MEARERGRGGQRWWKYARHRRQIADAAVDDAEQRNDGGLVGGDAVEIAHRLEEIRNLMSEPLSISRHLGMQPLAL